MKAPFHYLVRRPLPENAKPPLLLLLHGFGSNEKDLFGLADEFDPRFLVVSPRAPLTVREGSYAWFPVDFTPQGPVHDEKLAEKSRVQLVQFVDFCLDELGADARQVFVGGFSQGAIMASSLALTEPEKVAGAVLMSGRVLPEVVALPVDTLRRRQVPYLVVHGTADQVLPIHHGRQSREALRSVGIEPEYHEFAMPHTISDASLALVKEWLRTRAHF